MNARYGLRSGLRFLAALAAAACLSAFAQAPQASLSLTFAAPSGVVVGTESIPVVLRLTNNDLSLDFVVDNSLPNLGLDPAILPVEGNGFDPDTLLQFTAAYASYTSAFLNRAFGCSGSFTSACQAGPPYRFDFDPARFADPFVLAPGATFEYTLGSFVPSPSPVAPGTYEFYRSPLIFDIRGLDATGRPLLSTLFLSQTCDFNTAAECAASGFFTRTVVVVPEPQSWALMLLGLLATAGWARRRPRPGAVA